MISPHFAFPTVPTPLAFSHPVYVLVAALTSTILFVIAYAKPTAFESRVKTDYYDKLMFWCDTAGLGIFTVVGIQAAVRAVGGENVFFFVFIGTLTGVGGGVLRDIMAGETPYILVKHIYACAAIAGGIVCVVGRTAFGEAYGTILGLAATVLLRFLAAHFRWNLMRVS